MTCIDQEHRVARKPHRCALCGETIPIGEKYRRCVIKDGSDFYCPCFHAECDRVTEIDKWDLIDWEGWDEDEFRIRRDELRAEGKLEVPHA